MAEKGSATKAQIGYLKDLGVEETPSGLSFEEASAWIDEVKEYRRVSERGTIPEKPTRTDLLTVPPGRGKPAESAPEPVAVAKPAAEQADFKTALDVMDEKKTHGRLTLEQVTILKSLGRFPPDASPNEMAFGMNVANRLGLSPLKKQIRFLRFSRSEPIEPFVTIDGLSSIAARTGKYAGMDPVAVDVDPENQNIPISASATVYRMVEGQRCPFTSTVRWKEFAKKDREGNLTRAWAEMPTFMLSKVARAQALRMAFPEELSGVYEMDEAPVEEG